MQVDVDGLELSPHIALVGGAALDGVFWQVGQCGVGKAEGRRQPLPFGPVDGVEPARLLGALDSSAALFAVGKDVFAPGMGARVLRLNRDACARRAGEGAPRVALLGDGGGGNEGKASADEEREELVQLQDSDEGWMDPLPVRGRSMLRDSRCSVALLVRCGWRPERRWMVCLSGCLQRRPNGMMKDRKNHFPNELSECRSAERGAPERDAP